MTRAVPTVVPVSNNHRRQVWAKSNAVLAELDGVAWAHSYVTEDKIYCVYYADDPELIREHARRGGFPATPSCPSTTSSTRPARDRQRVGLVGH